MRTIFRQRLRRLSVLFLLCLISASASAQSRTTSAIAGVINDENRNPLAGVLIEISSPDLIGTSRTATSDDQGRFRFSQIPPGRYNIRAVLSGFRSVEINGLQIAVGDTAEVPIRMSLNPGQEIITVYAENKPVDPTTSAVPTILSHRFLENIPSDRDTTHILDFAPGINLESAYGGAEESGNSYQMDGVDISDPQGGAPWSLFNYSLIDEVQLIGLGAPAEYGGFTGVVYNTLTKSGSNRFSGLAEVFYTGNGLSATNGSTELSASIEQNAEGAFQMGGPIQKDRLWYFAAAQFVRDRSTEGGPIQKESDPRIFLKLTARPGADDFLEGWVEWDHTKIIGRDGDAFTPLVATTGEDNPEIVGNVSWRRTLSGNSVFSLSWGGYNGHHDFDPHNGFLIPGHIDATTGVASENAMQFGIVERTRNQINASLSQHVPHWISGFHDFKIGMEAEHSKVRDRYGFPGGMFFSDNEGPDEDPSTHREDFFTLKFTGGGYDAHGTGNRVSLFAQDSWRIVDSFTLNAGVRWDINRGSVSGDTVFRTNPIAPRIGFAWDLEGNTKSILRAHYGRYYEALYAAYFYYMDPGAFFPQTTQRIFNESGFTETISSSQGQKYAIDSDIRHPYLDQYILSFDRQLPQDITFMGTFVYRRNSDFIETVSRDGIFIPVTGQVPGTGQTVTLFDYLNPDTDVLLYTNPAGLKRTYRALILSATRRYKDNWQLSFSYVYSKTRGNIDNLGFDEFGTGGNTPFFDGHFLDTPNSFVNAQGRLTHDQTHQFKLQGILKIPSLHISISPSYTFHSGDTWTPSEDCLLTEDGKGRIDCHDFPQGPVLYLAEPRGSRRLPARNEIDLHAQWEQDFGVEQQFTVELDAFNLTNQSRATEVETIADEELGSPATLNFPRSVRIGLSWSW